MPTRPTFLGWKPTSAKTLAKMHKAGHVKFSHELDGKKAAVDWVESDCRSMVPYVEAQGKTSMCVGGSGAMALSAAFAKEGFSVHICPAAVYAPICGGHDGGASLGDCLTALQTYGAWEAGFENITQFDWRTAWHTKFWQRPTSKEAIEAAKYRIIEAVFCTSVDDFLAGLQSGEWAGQFAVGAGNSFETGSDGWLLPYDGTPCNHAQCATGGMKKHPTNGHWGLQGANPWGTGWGDGGFYWAEAEDWLDISGQELWLARVTTLPF